jgi:hypothetical protein
MSRLMVVCPNLGGGSDTQIGDADREAQKSRPFLEDQWLAGVKSAALARLEQVFSEFDVVRFNTSGLMVERDRAAVQIPAH